MNSLANLSKKSLKENKRKNILIILAIILAACLMTTICIVSYSINQLQIQRAEDRDGKAHAYYEHITDKQFEILKNHRKVEAAGEEIRLGVCKNEKISPYKISVSYEDEVSANLMNITLKEGNWPKKENEVVMPKWMLEKMGVEPKIGEEVNLEFQNTYVWQKTEFNIKDKFIVSGFIEESDRVKNEANFASAIVTKDYALKEMKPENINLEAYVRVKGFDIKKTANEVGENIGIVDSDYIRLNLNYIQALGADPEIIFAAAVIGVIVILATILVIYNIFNIYIREKIKMFGLLAAIGTTKKQIRKLVYKEGLILSIIGIPIGILLGTLLSFFIGPLTTIAGSSIKVKISPIIILLSAAISLFAITISLAKPSRIASKISPIEAVRYNEVQIKGKKRERKSNGVITLRKLSYFNLWRNKKRSITTILSISLTGILFIGFSTYFNCIDIDKLVHEYVTGDVMFTSNNVLLVDHKDNGTDPLNKDVMNNIKSLDGVNSVNVMKYCHPQLNNGKYCDLYGYDNTFLDELKKYITSGEISKEDLKNKNEVILYSVMPKYEVGDKVKMKYHDSESENNVIEKEFTIVAIVNKIEETLPFGSGGGTFITNEAAFNRIFDDDRIGRISINIDEKKYDNVISTIKSISDKDQTINYLTKKQFKDKEEQQMLGEKIASNTLVGIIGLLGIVNLINTMITSVMSRKKELGMMQAVGLTNKQLRKMLQIEGLYYSVIGIIISIAGGIGTGYLYYLAIKGDGNGNDHIIYRFPTMSIILVVAILLFGQMAITYMVERSLHKESVIDRVKYSE